MVKTDAMFWLPGAGAEKRRRFCLGGIRVMAARFALFAAPLIPTRCCSSQPFRQTAIFAGNIAEVCADLAATFSPV